MSSWPGGEPLLLKMLGQVLRAKLPRRMSSLLGLMEIDRRSCWMYRLCAKVGKSVPLLKEIMVELIQRGHGLELINLVLWQTLKHQEAHIFCSLPWIPKKPSTTYGKKTIIQKDDFLLFILRTWCNQSKRVTIRRFQFSAVVISLCNNPRLGNTCPIGLIPYLQIASILSNESSLWWLIGSTTGLVKIRIRHTKLLVWRPVQRVANPIPRIIRKHQVDPSPEVKNRGFDWIYFMSLLPCSKCKQFMLRKDAIKGNFKLFLPSKGQSKT